MTERTRLKEPMRSICIVEGALHRGRMASSCRDLGGGWRQGRQELAKRGGNSQCHFIILDWPTDDIGGRALSARAAGRSRPCLRITVQPDEHKLSAAMSDARYRFARRLL